MQSLVVSFDINQSTRKAELEEGERGEGVGWDLEHLLRGGEAKSLDCSREPSRNPSPFSSLDRLVRCLRSSEPKGKDSCVHF